MIGWAASLTTLLALSAVSACDTPTVEARALWLDQEHVGGERTVHIYSRGEFETMTLRPSSDLQDAERESLVLELGPRGRGALLMAADPRSLRVTGANAFQIAYLDLDERRALSIQVPLGLRAPAPVFSARGDAVTWIDPCARELAILPTTAGLQTTGAGGALEPWTTALGEGSLSCFPRWGSASATDAPVIFTGDASYAGELGNVLVPTPGGEVRAFRYAEGPEDSRLAVELGRGALLNDVTGVRPPGCAETVGCLGLVDPDGSALSVIGDPDDPCRIQRWSWVAQEGEDGEEPAPEPTSCVWTGSGEVIAAISGRHYVVLRESEVVRVDWTTGEEVALPLLGGRAPWSWHLDREGRTVIMVSRGGPMLRIASDQVELVNIVQTPLLLRPDACGRALRPVGGLGLPRRVWRRDDGGRVGADRLGDPGLGRGPRALRRRADVGALDRRRGGAPALQPGRQLAQRSGAAGDLAPQPLRARLRSRALPRLHLGARSGAEPRRQRPAALDGVDRALGALSPDLLADRGEGSVCSRAAIVGPLGRDRTLPRSPGRCYRRRMQRCPECSRHVREGDRHGPLRAKPLRIFVGSAPFLVSALVGLTMIACTGDDMGSTESTGDTTAGSQSSTSESSGSTDRC